MRSEAHDAAGRHISHATDLTSTACSSASMPVRDLLRTAKHATAELPVRHPVTTWRTQLLTFMFTQIDPSLRTERRTHAAPF